MKAFFSVVLALVLLAMRLPAAAQAPAWQSARAVAVATAAATATESLVTATAVDAAGNVFLAGFFTNTVVLGSTTLTSLGNNDMFVAKFNPVSNQFVWAQRAGGTNDDQATALAVSGTSVYVAGLFKSSAVGFGPVILTTAGYYDAFVAKLTDGGNTGSFVWAQRAGGTEEDVARALAVSGTSVYVAGHFAGSAISFGPVTLTNAGPNGSPDAFVAKLTDGGSTGSFVWAQRAGGTAADYARALAVSGTSVYVAGGFNSATASFGTATLTNLNATMGVHDVFVAKLVDGGSTGSFAWAQQAGGSDHDDAYALAVSGTSVYVAGIFGSYTATFGPATLTNANPTSSFDMFVAKLIDAGSTGSFAWAQRAGGVGNEVALALAVSGTSVYVGGQFGGATAGFGTTTLTNVGSTTGSADVFVAGLVDAGSTGSFAWARRAGGTGGENLTALAVSGTSVYAVGGFNSPTADFGTITLTNGNPDGLGFLASLTDPTLTATAPSRALPSAQLYPNPAHHTATLRLPVGTGTVPLTLSDALGRVVRRYPAPAGPEAALDLRGLPAGFYLLRGAGPVLRLAVE